MPSIIGSVQVVNVSGGVVNFGDAQNVSPKSNSKSYEGSGSMNTGGIIITNNGISSTNTIDKELVDQPAVANK